MGLIVKKIRKEGATMEDNSSKKKKKIKKIVVPLLVIFGIVYCFAFQLPTTIEVILYSIYGVSIKSDKIEFSRGQIIVKNVSFSYDGELIGKAPEIRAYYTAESLKNFRIELIEAENLEGYVTRNDKDINAAVAFTGSKNLEEKKFKEKFIEVEKKKNGFITDEEIEVKYKEYKKEETRQNDIEYERKKKSGKIPTGNVPINKIRVKNSKVEFRDRTFVNEIWERVYNINGELTFNKKTGMTIEATANNGYDETYQYLYSNKDERYWMDIKAKNISPKKEWIQYGYTNNDVAIWGGTIDVDMTVGSVSKIHGCATAKGVNGRYVFFDEDATDVNAQVEFDGMKMLGSGQGMVLGNLEKVDFTYDGISKFQMESQLSDIDGKYINKYYLLEDKRIDFTNSKIIKPTVFLVNDSLKDPKLEMTICADKIMYNNMELDKMCGKIVKGSEGVELKNINGLFKLYANANDKKEPIFENKVDLGLKYRPEDGEFLFTVFNGENSYLLPVEGKAKYKMTDDNILVRVDSSAINFDLDYNKKKNTVRINDGKKFNINYDLANKTLKEGGGKINLDLGYVVADINFEAKNNVINLSEATIEPKMDKTIESVEGDSKEKTQEKKDDDKNKTESNKKESSKKETDLLEGYESTKTSNSSKLSFMFVENNNGIIRPYEGTTITTKNKVTDDKKVTSEKKAINRKRENLKEEKIALGIEENEKVSLPKSPEKKTASQKKEKEEQVDVEEEKSKKFQKDESFWVPLEEANKKITLSGTMDLNKDIIDVGMSAEDFIINRKIKEKDIKVKTTFVGTVTKEGKEKPLDVDVDISELSLDYLLQISHLYGNFKLSKGKEIFSEFSGEIGKLAYNDYVTYGIKTGYGLRNNKLTITDFKNQLFNISGDINIDTKDLDMKVAITGLSSDQIPVGNLKFALADIRGDIKGNVESPLGAMKVNEAQVIFDENKIINLSGEIDYKDKKVTTNKFKINESFADGVYNLENNKYSGRINILEGNLTDYYTSSSLRHRLIGTVTVEGQGEKIKVRAEGTVDKAFFNRNKLPAIYTKAVYESDNLSDGIVTVENISIQNNEFTPLITGKGQVDLKEKTIDVQITNSILKLGDLSEFTKRNDIKGDIVINGQIDGTFDDMNYTFGAIGKEIAVADIKFNNFLVSGKGNLDNIILENASFNYLNNTLKASGTKELKGDKYGFNVQSSKIDLSFLNGLLGRYGVSNVNGTSNLNVTIENNANRGHFILNNFSINLDKYYIKLKDLNSQINLNGQVLAVEKFHGILNDGTIEAKGALQNLTLDTLSDENLRENLDYNIQLDLKKIDYKYSDNFNILINSDLNFHKNKLSGNIQIDEGLVSKIPVESRNIYQIIADFLFRSTSQVASASRDLGSDFAVDASFGNPFELDLAFAIKDGIKLDIKDVNAFVGDVKGDVFARGTLKGVGAELVLLGDAELKYGSVNINESIFTINRGVISFTKRNEYLPNINPSIYVDAKVEVDGEDLGVGISGELNKLRFNISSSDGNSSGDLRALLSGESDIQDETTAKLVKSILNDQISQSFIRPFTRKIKNFFGLTKFRLRSTFFGTKKTNRRYQDDETEFKFGVVLEAENNIYKDKLFWVASATLVDENQTNRKNDDESGTLNEYDFSVEYRYKEGRSIGLGVGRVPDYKRKSEDRNKNKNSINYHIDFKFEKKYDTILDIFKK